MARQKRPNPLLVAARAYLSQHMPELRTAPLHLRMLDGPPGSPCCAVTVEACRRAGPCPHGIAAAVAERGECSVRDCPLRLSVRLLISRGGTVVQATRSAVHW
jgi:hypothetical protein